MPSSAECYVKWKQKNVLGKKYIWSKYVFFFFVEQFCSYLHSFFLKYTSIITSCRTCLLFVNNFNSYGFCLFFNRRNTILCFKLLVKKNHEENIFFDFLNIPFSKECLERPNRRHSTHRPKSLERHSALKPTTQPNSAQLNFTQLNSNECWVNLIWSFQEYKNINNYFYMFYFSIIIIMTSSSHYRQLRKKQISFDCLNSRTHVFKKHFSRATVNDSHKQARKLSILKKSGYCSILREL